MGKVNVESATELSPLKKSHMIFFLFAILVLLFFVGYYYYNEAEKTVIRERYQELKTISDIKSKRIENWLFERHSDIKFFSNNKYLTDLIIQYMTQSNRLQIESEIKDILEPVLLNDRYNDILILTPQREITLSLKNGSTLMPDFLDKYIDDAEKYNTILISDLYKDVEKDVIFIDLIAPVADQNDSIRAFILFRVDPKIYFYPLVTIWPGESPSAETYLVRKEKDDVLILTDLRHARDMAFKLTIPLEQNEINAVKAVNGELGMFQGLDYRGNEVLSHLAKINGTNWYIITDIDMGEILSELHRREFALIIALIAILLFFMLGMVIFYSSRQKEAYRKLYLKEKSLRETNEIFRTTLYSIGDAVITTDNDGKVTRMNIVAEELTGWNENDAVGKSISTVFKIMNEKTMQIAENPVKKVLTEGKVVGLANNTLLVSKQGMYIPIADSGAPISDDEGNILGVVLVFHDQTEERVFRNQLAEANEFFTKLFNISPLATAILNADEMTYINISESFTRTLGFTNDEVISRSFYHLPIWFNPAKIVELVSILPQLKKIDKEEIQIINKGGEVRDNLIFLEYFGQNNRNYIIFQLLDVTSHHELINSITESEERYKLLFYSNPLPLIVYDNINDNIIDANNSACKIYEYGYSEILQLNHNSLIYNDYKINSQLREIITSITDNYSTRRTKNAKTFMAQILEHKINWQGQDAIMEMSIDLTLLIESKKKILEAKELAEMNDRLKTAFLSNMSHEIRTPLNGIIGFSDILLKMEFSDTEKEEFLQIINKSGKRLMNLVNDIVDLSKIQAGQVQVNYKLLNLNNLIYDLYYFFKPQADAKAITLKVNNESDNRKVNIVSDENKIHQILTNLISNAIKFTNVGYVQFGYELHEDKVVFTVSDTGIGIPEDNSINIFDRFTRIEREQHTQFDGTGLGLAISKGLVDLLGGQISYKSELGEATTFTFEIPYR